MEPTRVAHLLFCGKKVALRETVLALAILVTFTIAAQAQQQAGPQPVQPGQTQQSSPRPAQPDQAQPVAPQSAQPDDSSQGAPPDAESRGGEAQGSTALTPLPDQQERAEVPPPRSFYFTSPLSVSGVRENRLPLGNGQFSGDAEVMALPEMTFARQNPRTDFFLSYRPQLEYVNDNTQLNMWTHSASARFAHQTSTQWTTSFKDSFLHTYDATTALGDSLFLIPRGLFVEDVFLFDEEYQYDSRTSIRAGVDGSFSKLSLPDVHRFLPYLPANQFNSASGAVDVSVSRGIAANQRLTGSYSYLFVGDFTPQSASLVPLDQQVGRIHEGTLDYEWSRGGRGLSAELSAGILHSSSTSYTASARIGYNWETFSFHAGYVREVALLRGLGSEPAFTNPLLGGLFPGTVTQAVGMDLIGSVGRRLVVELHTSAGRDPIELRNNNYNFAGRFRVGYLIGGRVLPFVGAEYYMDDFNVFTQSRISRSRFSAGLSILLTPIREAETVPIGDYSASWPVGVPGFIPRTNPGPDAGVRISHVISENR